MTTTISIPIGDVEAEIDLDLSYDVEEAVSQYFENNNVGGDSADVADEVTNLLNEYCRQQENGRQTCDVGRSFEKAVEYASLKAFKKLLGQA